MTIVVENKRQCRFCRHFKKEVGIDLLPYRCLKGNFPRVGDITIYPEKRAETCADFELDSRSKSSYTNSPSDSSSFLT